MFVGDASVDVRDAVDTSRLEYVGLTILTRLLNAYYTDRHADAPFIICSIWWGHLETLSWISLSRSGWELMVPKLWRQAASFVPTDMTIMSSPGPSVMSAIGGDGGG